LRTVLGIGVTAVGGMLSPSSHFGEGTIERREGSSDGRGGLGLGREEGLLSFERGKAAQFGRDGRK